MTDARIAALQPLADIADAFNSDGLDEARPSWGDTRESAGRRELYQGRGGKTLLTLEQCFAARDALRDSHGWKTIDSAPIGRVLVTKSLGDPDVDFAGQAGEGHWISIRNGRKIDPPTHWFDIPELDADGL